MTKFFIKPFAEGGDKSVIPDDIQPGGSVSYQQGFGVSYQLDIDTDPLAIPIPRNQSNQLYFDITDALQQYQTHGVPDFITTLDNDNVPYPYDIYAQVRYDDGGGFRIYENQLQGNTSLPTDPSWALISGGQVPVGTVLTYAANAVPPGFLSCDGAAVNRATYAALFNVIGTTWGAGDGLTTFNVPPSGRFVMGSGGAAYPGVIGNSVGDLGGTGTVTLTEAQMPVHDHPPIAGGTAFAVSSAFATNLAPGNSGLRLTVVSTTGNAGGGAPHSNIPQAMVMRQMIKT